MSNIGTRFLTVRYHFKNNIAALIALSLVFSNGVVAEDMPVDGKKLSGEYSMVLHPSGVKKTGEAEFNNIMEFFHKAERAIESEDLEALMALYSERYKNIKSRDKKFAENVWKKIFADFDDLSSRHRMEVINYEKRGDDYQLAVTECSGLLTGTPKGSSRAVTIDSWGRQRHILINEGNSWKLFGNAGRSAKRYGDETGETHPLF